MDFPDFAPPTVVSREAVQIHHFIDEQRDVILKPLDGMGGSQIFRVHRHDPNRNVIVETLTQDGTRTIMAQRYLPEISAGDKRIPAHRRQAGTLVSGAYPKAGETRGNLATGGTGVVQELSADDRRIAEALGPVLFKRGLMLVGLDVIGTHLTESTSPARPAWSRSASNRVSTRPAPSFPPSSTHVRPGLRLFLPSAWRPPVAGRCGRTAAAGTAGLRVRHPACRGHRRRQRPGAGRQAIAAVLREFDRLHRRYHAWQPSELSASESAMAGSAGACRRPNWPISSTKRRPWPNRAITCSIPASDR